MIIIIGNRANYLLVSQPNGANYLLVSETNRANYLLGQLYGDVIISK